MISWHTGWASVQKRLTLMPVFLSLLVAIFFGSEPPVPGHAIETLWKSNISLGQWNRIESSETEPCVHMETQDTMKVLPQIGGGKNG